MLYRAKTRRRGADFLWDQSIDKHALRGVFFVWKILGGEAYGPQAGFNKVFI